MTRSEEPLARLSGLNGSAAIIMPRRGLAAGKVIVRARTDFTIRFIHFVTLLLLSALDRALLKCTAQRKTSIGNSGWQT